MEFFEIPVFIIDTFGPEQRGPRCILLYGCDEPKVSFWRELCTRYSQPTTSSYSDDPVAGRNVYKNGSSRSSPNMSKTGTVTLHSGD